MLTSRTEKAEYMRNLIKFHAGLKGINLRQVQDVLRKDYGWTTTQSNFSNRLKRGSFDIVDLQEIFEVIGKKITVEDIEE